MRGLTREAATELNIVGGRMRAVATTMELTERSLKDRERFGFEAPNPLVEARSDE